MTKRLLFNALFNVSLTKFDYLKVFPDKDKFKEKENNFKTFYSFLKLFILLILFLLSFLKVSVFTQGILQQAFP
jgi:hypothetical protein